MELTSNMYNAIFDLLIKLHANEITPETAMSRLMPQLLACKTARELAVLEPVKDLVMSWYDIHPESRSGKSGPIDN
jgi:hypothetical protein